MEGDTSLIFIFSDIYILQNEILNNLHRNNFKLRLFISEIHEF